MARKKPQLDETPTAEIVDEFEAPQQEAKSAPRVKWRWRILIGGALLALLLFGSFRLVYGDKIYPGVSADGVSLGGLTKVEAVAKLEDKINDFSGQSLTIKATDNTWRLPVKSLDAKYDTKLAADQAFRYGRMGDWKAQLWQQIRSLLGRSTIFTIYTYSDNELASFINQIAEDVTLPVTEAGLNFDGNKAGVTPGKDGTRLDLGRLLQAIEDRIAGTDTNPIAAPTYQQAPAIDSVALGEAVDRANTYIAGPIALTRGDITQQIDQATIISWIKVNRKPTGNFMTTHDLVDLYPSIAPVTLALDRGAIVAYVAELAAKIDKAPRNARLDFQDGHAIATTSGVDGAKLDQSVTLVAIIDALEKSADNRTIALKVDVQKAAIREDNLADLGIKELISEGETYFPGSTSTRLINVRTGAAQFNGAVVAPGEVFSFGNILGAVGPEQGYVPERVILGDHVEKQYGGGLCQVSTTAFRAALLAGVPILERTSHAFAVSYYTWPYGVPGVDATIYFPPVDFKFKNDTGSYIYIKTSMEGVHLKFDFYGTKTKTGVIRGPYFVTGNNNPTIPSHTVFYRDILDLSGHVTKTDTFNTYYKSSLDFPIQ